VRARLRARHGGRAVTNKPWRDVLPIHPAAEMFPLMSQDELRELGEDIEKYGLKSRVTFWAEKPGEEKFLLDGRNRLDAMEMAGLDPHSCSQVTLYGNQGVDPCEYVISVNLKRRHLNESQRAMVAAKLATLRRGDNQHSPIGETSQAKAASLLNVGKRSVERASEVRDHGAPELVHAVEHGDVSVSAAADVASLPIQRQCEIVARGEKEILRAAAEIRRNRAGGRYAEHAAKLIAISNSNAPLPKDRKYPIILADPPWTYDHPPPMRGEYGFRYPTMSLEEISGLPVADLATPDAALFLWAPPAMLPKALTVIQSWGFEYRTNAVWIKDRHGWGYYFRTQHEHLLFAARGNLVPVPKNLSPSVITAPRREHSRKPDEVYSLIERMYPELPKIELFARSTRKGWRVWAIRRRKGHY
jgi:N6-adenosine-specific RNA methylase IME4